MFKTQVLRLEEITKPIFKDHFFSFTLSDFKNLRYDHLPRPGRLTFMSEKSWETPLGVTSIGFETRESLDPVYRLWFSGKETTEPFIHVDVSIILRRELQIRVIKWPFTKRLPEGIRQITLTPMLLGDSGPDF